MQSLLDEQEAAALLRLSVKTLQRRRVRGNGPSYVKLGGRVFYRESDLEAHIAESVRRSTSDVPNASSARPLEGA